MRIATPRGLLLAGTMLGGLMTGAPALAATAADPAAPAATQTTDDNGDAITVVGTPSDAKNLQFSSKLPVAVLSKEDLERSAARNVAEALGMLPGINVISTGSGFFGGADGASRGEGQTVSIRGLNAEYNVNLINGVTVAQGEPYSRQVSLGLLPPTGLNTIVLNKSSTAAMDGDAIGGTVDFRTPNAFDFSKPFYASITANGRLESRARDYGDSGLGGGGAAEIAKRFGGDGQFGIYISGYYDRRNYTNSEMRGAVSALNDGGWAYLVADKDGNSYPGLDPEQNATQTGIDVGVSQGSVKRWGGSASLDWKPDDTTHFYLRGTYARNKTQQNSTLSQYSSSSKSYNLINGSTDRYALSVDGISSRLYYETNPEDSELDTAALGGTKKLGQWTVAAEGFFSYGHDDRPNHIEASSRINQSDTYNHGSVRPLGGLSIGYTDNFPRPLLTTDIYNDLNNSSSVLPARRAGQLTESFSDQYKYGGRIDVSRDFSDHDGILRSISFGGKVTSSDRHVTSRDWTNDMFANLVGKSVTWDELGLTDGSYAHVFPGEYGWSIPKISQKKLFDYFYKYQNASSFDTCGSLYVNNYNCDTQKGSETVWAGYATANLKVGDVELIPGLRFEHTDIHNIYWVMQSDSTGELPGSFQSNNTHYNALLPSLFVNYRPSPTIVTRGDVWLSYTRPAFFQLGGGATRSVSDDGNVTITQGNPDLKPIRAINVDASGEWKFAEAGYATLGFYYKHLSHYLYDAGAGQANSTGNGTNQTLVYTPRNGGSGHVYGIEGQIRKKFVELPGLLGGLGVNFDFTRQWTRVDIGGGVMKPIQNAPKFMANVGLFYEKDRVSWDINYHYSGSYVETYDYLGQGGWDDRWVRPVKDVDLHVGYDFGHGLKANLSITNLFDTYSYWAHVGRHSLAISDVVDTGRTGLLSVKYSF